MSGLSFVESYAFLDDWVIGALNDLGIEATYQTGLDRAALIDRMVASFEKRYGLSPGTIDAATVATAKERVDVKFGTPE